MYLKSLYPNGTRLKCFLMSSLIIIGNGHTPCSTTLYCIINLCYTFFVNRDHNSVLINKYLKRRLQSPLLKYTYFIGEPPLFLIISWSSGSSFETAMELQYAKQNKKPSLLCDTHYQAHLINEHVFNNSLGWKWLCKRLNSQTIFTL